MSNFTNESGTRENSVMEARSYDKVIAENFNLRLRCYNLIKELEKTKNGSDNQTVYAHLLAEYDEVCEENRRLKLTNARLNKFDNSVGQMKEMRRIIDDFKAGMVENDFESMQIAFGNLLESNFENIEENNSLKRQIVELDQQMNACLATRTEDIRTTLEERVEEQIKKIQTSFHQNLDESLQYTRTYISNHCNSSHEIVEETNVHQIVMTSVEDVISPVGDENPNLGCNECKSLKCLLDKNMEDYTAFSANYIQMEREKRELIKKIEECEQQICELQKATQQNEEQNQENVSSITTKDNFKTMIINGFKKLEACRLEKNKLKTYYCNEMGLMNRKNFKLTEKLLQLNKKVEDLTHYIIVISNFTGGQDEENSNLVKNLQCLMSKSDKNTDQVLQLLETLVKNISNEIRKLVIELQNTKQQSNDVGHLTDCIRSASSGITQLNNGVEEVKYRLHEISLNSSFVNSIDSMNMTIASDSSRTAVTPDVHNASILNNTSDSTTRFLIESDHEIKSFMQSLKLFGKDLNHLVKKMTIIDLNKTLPKDTSCLDLGSEDRRDQSNMADLAHCNIENHTEYVETIHKLRTLSEKIKINADKALEKKAELESKNVELLKQIEHQDKELNESKNKYRQQVAHSEELCEKVRMLENDVNQQSLLIDTKEKLIMDKMTQFNNLTESFCTVSEANKQCHVYIRQLYETLYGRIGDEDNVALEAINPSIQGNETIHKMMNSIRELVETNGQLQEMIEEISQSKISESLTSVKQPSTENVTEMTKNLFDIENMKSSASRSTVLREINSATNLTRTLETIDDYKKDNEDLVKEVKNLKIQLETLKNILHGYKVSIPKMHEYIESYQKQSNLLTVYINKALRYLPDDLKTEFQETSANFDS